MDINRLQKLYEEFGPFGFSDGSGGGEQDLIHWKGSCTYLEGTVGYEPEGVEALIELANAIPDLIALLRKE